MNESNHLWVPVAVVILLVVALFLVAEQRDELKSEAVKRGAAEWVVDPANGATTFMWKEPTK